MNNSCWICQSHYVLLCKSVGHKIAVYTIPNWFRRLCQIDECMNIAKHLIDYSEEKAKELLEHEFIS